MVKHRRWSDKPKPEPTQEKNTDYVEQEISDPKTTMDLKSILQSGTKYAYIIAVAALLSGVFTPLTIGVEVEEVIFAMLTIFLGLGGGIAIFLGTKKTKFSSLFIVGGLAMIVSSLFLMYEIIEKPLFG